MMYFNEDVICHENGDISRRCKRGGRNGKTGEWIDAKKTSFSRGYLQIEIDGKKEKWHRVIWTAFNGEIPDGYDIHHKNGIKTDNRIENLECISKPKHDEEHYDERVRFCVETKSKPVIGVNIKTGYVLEFNSMAKAEDYGFNHGHICACVNGKRKSHKGYTWQYA